MEVRKKVVDEEHPNTLTSMHNLAYTLKSQSRNEETISLMKRCFHSGKQVLGSRHPSTETSLKLYMGGKMEDTKLSIQIVTPVLLSL